MTFKRSMLEGFVTRLEEEGVPEDAVAKYRERIGQLTFDDRDIADGDAAPIIFAGEPDLENRLYVEWSDFKQPGDDDLLISYDPRERPTDLN